MDQWRLRQAAHLVAKQSFWRSPGPGPRGDLVAERGDAHESGEADVRQLSRAIGRQQHVGALQIQHDHLEAVQVVQPHQYLVRHPLPPASQAQVDHI